MILSIKTKCELIDLINSKDSGIDRQYLLTPHFKNKIDKIVFVSYVLINQFNYQPFIEVKYNFGRRPKRVEIVFKNQDELFLCKITNFSEFDKDALELSSIVIDVVNSMGLQDKKVKGILFFLEDYNDLLVNQFIENQGLPLKHQKIS